MRLPQREVPGVLLSAQLGALGELHVIELLVRQCPVVAPRGGVEVDIGAAVERGVGMSGFDEAGDEFDHLRDVPGRARFTARRQNVERVVGGGEGAFVLIRVSEPLPSFFDGLRQDLVVDVSDVADHGHPVAGVEQPAAKGIEHRS